MAQLWSHLLQQTKPTLLQESECVVIYDTEDVLVAFAENFSALVEIGKALRLDYPTMKSFIIIPARKQSLIMSEQLVLTRIGLGKSY